MKATQAAAAAFPANPNKKDEYGEASRKPKVGAAMTTDMDEFIDAMSRHRNWERALDPPIV